MEQQIILHIGQFPSACFIILICIYLLINHIFTDLMVGLLLLLHFVLFVAPETLIHDNLFLQSRMMK